MIQIAFGTFDNLGVINVDEKRGKCYVFFNNLVIHRFKIAPANYGYTRAERIRHINKVSEHFYSFRGLSEICKIISDINVDISPKIDYRFLVTSKKVLVKYCDIVVRIYAIDQKNSKYFANLVGKIQFSPDDPNVHAMIAKIAEKSIPKKYSMIAQDHVVDGCRMVTVRSYQSGLANYTIQHFRDGVEISSIDIIPKNLKESNELVSIVDNSI